MIGGGVVDTIVWLTTSRTSPSASQLPPTEASPNFSQLDCETFPHIQGGAGLLPWAKPHPTSPPFWYVPFDPSGGACSPTWNSLPTNPAGGV